jgi:hypothetical protein
MIKLYLIDCLNTLDVESVVFYIEQGRIQGAHQACAPPKIGKNMIFGRKIVIFHTKYLKNIRASLGN